MSDVKACKDCKFCIPLPGGMDACFKTELPVMPGDAACGLHEKRSQVRNPWDTVAQPPTTGGA